MKKIIHLVCTMLWVPILSFAQYDEDTLARNTKARNYFIRNQYAGNLGMFSMGFGSYFYNNRIYLDAGYGYLPKSANGAKIHTFALKSSYQLVKYKHRNIMANGYLGSTLTYSILPNTYIKYPDYYPDDYYKPNAIHLNPFAGISVGYKSLIPNIDQVNIYSELGTVDYKLWYSLTTEYVKFTEIWNVCFGLIFHLEN